MHDIKIDSEVFEYLKTRATPFEDTPNSVLRRELGLEKSGNAGGQKIHRTSRTKRETAQTDRLAPEQFAKEILESVFGGSASKVAGLKTMYSVGDRKVYFQNYNKAGDAFVWYRLSGSPWALLKSEAVDSVVCFTNPAERFAYIIPVSEITKAIDQAGEDLTTIEVIIYPADHRWKWRNLDWNVSSFFKQF